MWTVFMVFAVAFFIVKFFRSRGGRQAHTNEERYSGDLVYGMDVVERETRQHINSLPKEGVITVAFVDTETTGLQKQDELITLGILLVEVDLPKGHLIRQIDKYYGVREPSVAIHRAAAKVHGLTKEDLVGKQLDLDRVRGLLEKANVLIAHNAQFDRRMIAKVVPEVVSMPWRCSVRQVRWPQELANKKLDTICGHFDVDRPLPHNALTDAKAMADCLFMRTGKTERSKSYLASCLSKIDF